MNKQALKEMVCKTIDEQAGRIIGIGDKISRNPELGYKEYKTAALVESVFEELKLPFENKIAITGSKAVLKGKSTKARVAVMGELDAVLCPEHPHADIVTGAAHSCGHNIQIACMLGTAMALKLSGAGEQFSGDVVFMAVPAEEPVEIEFRQRLREEGKIEFLGGKQEFIRVGAMDDIDMTVMFHSTSRDDAKVVTHGSSNGFIAKFVKYKGREAHAGGSPHLGVNALNAAILGLQGINANRETFKDDDCIRVHPIITKGGDLVNIVPADVRIETYVRGKTMEAVLDASKKVNSALQAGAMAVGAEVEIKEIPGYLPRSGDPILMDLYRANAEAVVGAEHVVKGKHGTGSSDIGDIMHIMPAIHPNTGGITGRGHTKDYEITDKDLAYIVSTKLLAMTVIDLLADGAETALEVKAQKPQMTKKEYLHLWKVYTQQVDTDN